jgi:hypothetical protein
MTATPADRDTRAVVRRDCRRVRRACHRQLDAFLDRVDAKTGLPMIVSLAAFAATGHELTLGVSARQLNGGPPVAPAEAETGS